MNGDRLEGGVRTVRECRVHGLVERANERGECPHWDEELPHEPGTWAKCEVPLTEPFEVQLLHTVPRLHLTIPAAAQHLTRFDQDRLGVTRAFTDQDGHTHLELDPEAFSAALPRPSLPSPGAPLT